MAGIPHDHYEPKPGFQTWLHNRLPIVSIAYDTLMIPTPKNLNWMWIWGIVLAFCLGLQIVTGVVLVMHYTPHVDLAFKSVEHIDKAWLIAAPGLLFFALNKYLLGALNGMMEDLDPHSQFMDEEAYGDMKDDTAGQFGGLGIVISVKDSVITIIAPMEDTPGFRAGLLSGDKIMEIDGALGCCVVDSNSGMMLGSSGGGATINLEIAAAGNTEVVRAKRKTMKALGLNDQIDDILITLGKQYHLIRPLAANEALFVYLVLDKVRGNLAMARHQLSALERDLVL